MDSSRKEKMMSNNKLVSVDKTDKQASILEGFFKQLKLVKKYESGMMSFMIIDGILETSSKLPDHSEINQTLQGYSIRYRKVSQSTEGQETFSPQGRAFLFIGLLGAFTTFSTFGNESFNLWQDGNNLLAWGNVGLHIVLGLGAVWLGRFLGLTFNLAG